MKSERHMHEIKLERNSNKKGYTNKPQIRQQDFLKDERSSFLNKNGERMT